MHLQLSFFSDHNVSELSEDTLFKDSPAHEVMTHLGFDSFTNYNWACSVNIDKDFCDVLTDMKNLSDTYAEWEVSYCPNVTVGWDNNVRFHRFIPGVMKNNTPENFEKALLWAKDYIDTHPKVPKLITINSWNEWTETSYLEPDDLYGYGYLESIRKVFKND
ncbi:hypothetical protein SDC9_162450 [bioreactor metagenome]|uniref:GH26 domain-containing protein n=1 Tax=bioreactor metagenome TaxID=1076179 RepID=A0A645FL44_9ZZZZ